HPATPLLLETVGTVAAEVPLVGPQRAIGVEVFRGEDVDLERLDAIRCGAATRGAEEPFEPVAGRTRIERTDEPVLLRIAFDLARWNRFDVLDLPPHLPWDRWRDRRAATDAGGLDARRFGARRTRHRHGHEQRGKGGTAGFHGRRSYLLLAVGWRHATDSDRHVPRGFCVDCRRTDSTHSRTGHSEARHGATTAA